MEEPEEVSLFKRVLLPDLELSLLQEESEVMLPMEEVEVEVEKSPSMSLPTLTPDKNSLLEELEELELIQVEPREEMELSILKKEVQLQS